MNSLNSYLYKELSNLPFQLFQIIKDYIKQHPNVKVAIVGGYIRDLLIRKIHNKEFPKLIDLDIVIEGSSLSLAKFIKKNIRNVDFCLIKEFEIYNTVEIDINDIKIDIASARKEVYLFPGFNPEITETDIKEDLKRRDFTINSIAYEISNNEIYDLFNGINHLFKKELHLLHARSISDDPSRLLRCAKYAARLDFTISAQSLIQSQKIVKLWPWKPNKAFNGGKFPPGISIRMRMELTEIFKRDNLAKIISLLNQWEVNSLINPNLKVTNKFLRGLNWIKKLNGKLILFLGKDSDSLDLFCDRFFINNKEKKILEDYLTVKKTLELNKLKFKKFTPSKWTDFIEINNLEPETIKILISEGGIFWRQLLKWLLIYRNMKSNKSGKTLIEEGWESGKKLGDELKRLRYLQIDNYKKKTN